MFQEGMVKAEFRKLQQISSSKRRRSPEKALLRAELKLHRTQSVGETERKKIRQ
jgi:hypothetical protein